LKMKLSIITVCFNAGQTVRDTIASVAIQNWPSFEHIIIDGGSSDDTLSIIESMKYDRLRVFTGPDGGIYDAMNKGLARATGDYVAFLNADDLYVHADVLRGVAEAAASSECDLILGDTQFFDAKNPRAKSRYYSSRNFSTWWIKIGIMPPHPSLFARRNMLVDAGGFDTSYRICADFDLIARLVLRHEASWITLNRLTTLFRVGGISTDGGFVRPALSIEMVRSLKSLNIAGARLRVLLRYPVKALQYITFFSNQEIARTAKSPD
jgi:glycosyltransferase involved in cell wall biosynthesis